MQTDTERRIHKDTGRHTYKYRLTVTGKYRQPNGQTHMHTQTDTQTHIDTVRHTDMDRHRQKQSNTDRQTDMDKNTCAHTDKTHRHI